MKIDLILGVVMSVTIHGGFIFGGELFKPAKAEAPKKEEVTIIEVSTMPPPEPEEPEVVESSDAGPTETMADFAPPSLADSPSPNITSSFTQAMQPPPPPDMQRSVSLSAIPTGAPRTGPVKANLSSVFDLKDLDQKPEPRFQPGPIYPFEMKKNRIRGLVEIGFVVDASGNVRDPYVIKSSHREFEVSATQCVAKWKFNPGKKGGNAVSTRMSVPIKFSLTES